MSEHASVVKFTGDRVAGFVESERQNVKSAADEVGSQIETQLIGEPPQGENDTLIAATILIGALNARGATWGAVKTTAEPVDCEAKDSNGRTLRMQVVRASRAPWRDLANVGKVNVQSEIDDLVNELETAIKNKAAHYPPAIQAGLILALDANRLPAFILSNVREAAIARLQSVCEKLAFASVWVVGPTCELTYGIFENAL